MQTQLSKADLRAPGIANNDAASMMLTLTVAGQL